MRIERAFVEGAAWAVDAALDLLRPEGAFEVIVFDQITPLIDLRPSAASTLIEAARNRGAASVRTLEFSWIDPQLAVAHVAARRRPTNSLMCVTTRNSEVNFETFDPRDTRQRPRMSRCTVGEGMRVDARVVQMRVAAERLLNLAARRQALHWYALGHSCGETAARLVDACGYDRVVIPAHAGAAPSVGLFLQDLRVSLVERWPDEADGRCADARKLRASLGRLMDQAATIANQNGYDTDDMTCERFVDLQSSDNDLVGPLRVDEFESIDELIRRAGLIQSPSHSSSSGLVWVEATHVIATIETRKPRLPPIAESTTIIGAGVPEKTTVDGPGTMRACLCEIDVPASWRAVFEDSGDVVLTKLV